MATISSYKLNGTPYTPPKEWPGLEVLATFETRDDAGAFLSDSVQASITTNEFSFVNDAKAAIDSWFAGLPTEGMPFTLDISNETTTNNAFTGYLDFRTLQYKSDIELICGIKQDNGLATLDTRLKGITMELLQQKGALVTGDFINIPYVVENRKTLLEKVALLGQLYVIIKTGVDEIYKFLNIAADMFQLTGVIQAIVNLTVTITNLIILIGQLVNLLGQIQDAFFPPIRYHRGIALKKAIEKAVGYCGFTLECGILDPIISKTGLCPSKNDEIGLLSPVGGGSGILKPGDFGYVTSDLFGLANMLFYTKVAIVGNTVQLRPFNDPYWTSSSTYTMPNVLIEQTFVNNGGYRPNYDELKSSRILQYTTDDSDLWSLTTVAEQISVTTVTPITVLNQKRVLLTDSEQITIPYALAVRKDALDDLLDLFTSTTTELNIYKQAILNYFNSVATILSQAFPTLDSFTNTIMPRNGCMKVENHYFSTPKIVYLEDDNRIPSNYASIIGAVALSNNYHSYKSFVPGVRDPLNLANTNSKHIYEDVRIPMGINDFNTLAVNSFFTTNTGNIGKFTSIKWRSNKDDAIVSFWVQNQWATNIEETTI